ncbi:MAG: Asp-tRNA(Asn)/Glu-tRNA(Gln) amidotransferase subunit GatA [Phycisphaeraceae bacterium]|nr:Asp-tRNA(Asn)/Glu-tRNA(Gln) amidotransferase subunit GatA [Phycisphaeraceae bacterium]
MSAAQHGAASAGTGECLCRIHQLNPTLNAFISVLPDPSPATSGPLTGFTVAVKDNLCFADHSNTPTTAGSRILTNYKSPFTATAVQRLIDAGATIVGKTNLDEFAMGSTGENSAFGPTRNPWDLDRIPGGSSSGSAGAVAAGLVRIALGSDTGGSIRQPAGMCGIVGLKPTYGRVSRYGLIAYASSLDQVGPMARTVADAAAALTVISGPDPLDSTCADQPVPDFTRDLDRPVEHLTIGVPRQARNEANNPDVAVALEAAIETYRSLGAAVIEVDLPHTEHGIAAYYIVALAEASSNLARFDGVRYGRRTADPKDLMDLYARSRAEGFGPEVQRRIMLGTYILSAGYYEAYYTTALKVRRLIKRDYDAAFGTPCDAILMPTSPRPAFRLGERVNDPLAMYLEDVYTVGVNLAGLPAIAFPAGFSRVGMSRLPIGMQLIGPAWQEARLLRAAQMFESATQFHTQVPPCAESDTR